MLPPAKDLGNCTLTRMLRIVCWRCPTRKPWLGMCAPHVKGVHCLNSWCRSELPHPAWWPWYPIKNIHLLQGDLPQLPNLHRVQLRQCGLAALAQVRIVPLIYCAGVLLQVQLMMTCWQSLDTHAATVVVELPPVRGPLGPHTDIIPTDC